MTGKQGTGRWKKYRRAVHISVVTEQELKDALLEGSLERVGNHDDVNSIINEGIRLMVEKYGLSKKGGGQRKDK